MSGEPGIICTSLGVRFDVRNPKPTDILIEDIAQGLANKCRFGGHTNKFYSVAQHSIAVSRMVGRKFKLAALLHDAAEAYMTDLPTPIKALLPEYRVMEQLVLRAVFLNYGIPPAWVHRMPEEILMADHEQYEIERHHLMPNVRWWENPHDGCKRKITILARNVVRHRFLQEFEGLIIND